MKKREKEKKSLATRNNDMLPYKAQRAIDPNPPIKRTNPPTKIPRIRRSTVILLTHYFPNYLLPPPSTHDG